MPAYYLKAFSSPVIDKINPCESGWQIDESGCLIPLWYRGPQMPAVVRAEWREVEYSHQVITDAEVAGGENKFVDALYTSSEEDFWEEFDSDCDGYDSNDPEYLP
eukprot:gene16145-7508_t